MKKVNRNIQVNDQDPNFLKFSWWNEDDFLIINLMKVNGKDEWMLQSYEATEEQLVAFHKSLFKTNYYMENIGDDDISIATGYVDEPISEDDPIGQALIQNVKDWAKSMGLEEVDK